MIVILLVGTNGMPKSYAESPSAQEYQIKAAFLYNFAKFIEWPPSAFAPNHAGLNLCLLGEEPFGVALNSIRGKTIRGKEVVIKQFAAAENLERCHILFISA
ncbi:MAG: YfiR family protein, partial [Candidatus Tectomicrobia bacterium]|nr:YfiR family protein [Candidatus Tectomicrobia bacterium]